MRVIFIGSGTFATKTFDALLLSGHDVLAAVTQPPRRAGRGAKLRTTPIESVAEDAGVEVYSCPNINADSSIAYLRNKKPDVLCVAEFGQFLGSAVRQLAPLGAFNLHSSLLPELRGAAPVNWALIHGMKKTGVTTFSMVGKMDAGAIYLSAELDIEPEERADELRERLGQIGADVVLQTLELLGSGSARPRPQDDSKATFAPLLKKNDGFLNFAIPAEHIVWKVRGMWPWPGARAVFGHTEARAIPITIARARVGEGPAKSRVGALDEDLCVSTGLGRLQIVEIKPAGKRLMTWRDFVNGYRVSPGDLLNLPESPSL